MRLLLHGLRGKRGTGACVFFLVFPLTQTIMTQPWGGWDGALVMRQPTDALRRISFPIRSRCSHMESGAPFPLTLSLAVIVLCVWVLLLRRKMRFYGRCLFPWVQYLVRQWIHVMQQYFGGCGRIAHIFYVAAGSNPEVLLSLLLRNGEACPVDAFGCSFAPRSSHMDNWKYFYELHVAETSDEG